MKKIALIGCTSDKLDGPCPAIEIYTKSSYFNSKLKYCEKINVDEIFILSAKYGFLKPDEIIEYYDETLKGKPKDHKIKWTNKVLNDLKENCDIENDKFVILAGNDYTKYLLEHLNNYYNPVKGLGIGSQHNYFNTVSKDNTIGAIDIRNDFKMDNNPGYYKWWASKKEFNLLLDKLDIDFESIKDSIEIKDKWYCIYVGIAVKESVHNRLNWHVNDTHSESKVKHGTLSTFRQTLSSILSEDQSDKLATDNFIDKLIIEYCLFDYPIKSIEAKEEIEAIEKELLQKNLYILNIKENYHEKAKPIRKKLTKLRKKGKQNAMEYFEMNKEL